MLNADTLATDYKTMTMKEMAAKYGVALSTVFRWCQIYGIKTQKSAVKGIVMTYTHREVFTGSLLGDGSLEQPQYSKNAGFCEEHSTKQTEYIWWKFGLIKALCNRKPVVKERRIRIRTGFHPDFLPMHRKWYPNGKKVVPSSEIESFLTPLALAIWFMDDGSVGNQHGVSGRIATASFTFDEVEYLSCFLDRKYNIQSSVHSESGYPRLYIPGKGHFIPGKGWKSAESQFGKFVSLIRPYIPASMLYKLGKV